MAKALTSLVTAITAIYGVSNHEADLNKWGAEIIGKRRAELAETVLADFYRFEDVVRNGPITFTARRLWNARNASRTAKTTREEAFRKRRVFEPDAGTQACIRSTFWKTSGIPF